MKKNIHFKINQNQEKICYLVNYNDLKDQSLAKLFNDKKVCLRRIYYYKHRSHILWHYIQESFLDKFY